MLTTWLTLTAFLSASAVPRTAANGWDALTVAPTFRVKGQVGAELTLNCGDGKSRGAVEHWHTPFGDPHSLGLGGERDPVCVRHDGSLVLTNLSSLHAGLYHCLLRLARGSTLFPYDLQVHHKERGGSFEREAGSEPEEKDGEKVGEEEGVSDGQFAGAVAASVILTFVVGFGAGALSRAHVLRCLGAITQKLPRTRRPKPRSGVTVATLPPMYENQAFQMERLHDSDTADGDTVDSTLSTTSFPPAKPKRSFRDKRHQEDQETAAYLEACDRHKEEETETARGQAEGTEEEKLERVRINQSAASETSEDQSEDGEQEIKAKVEMVKEKREEPGEQEDTDKSERQEEKVEEEEEDISARTNEGEETDSSDRSSTDTEEEEAGSEKEEDTSKGSKDGDGAEAVSSSAPSRGRRSRVIRLYQYDEEGQRFYHLPKPGPEEAPAPAPRLKARSASLTRLSAIMAAAAAGPLDATAAAGPPPEGEADQTDGQVKARFQMDI